MAIDLLQNEYLQIAVKRLGAELTSITDANGTEYLWQGDPRIWDGRSPLLFPIVGRLSGDSYSYAGKTYSLPQHGFARQKEFSLVGLRDDCLTYSLEADESTRLVYPFDFVLTVSYLLDGNSVRAGLKVTNFDDRPLPFSIGGHPGFSCSWLPGDALEDYYLEFEQAETADTCLVRNGLIAITETKRILTNDRILPLTKTLFDHNALVFMKFTSSTITLCSRRQPNTVRVDFPGFPCLGIWSKPAAPFVCIEPWHGYADPVGRNPGSPLETKPGIVILHPHRSFECGWRARITDS